MRIYDFDMVEDCYYIAMELVHGRDLKQTLELCGTRGTRLTVPRVEQITAEVCRTLDYAHKKVVDGRPLNIIHRDVSPHQAPLPQTGAPIIEPDMSEIVSMATAMFDRPDFDEGPAAAQPGRTMPLESMDVNDFQDPVLRQQIEERHRASLGPDGLRMTVPAPGGADGVGAGREDGDVRRHGGGSPRGADEGISVTPEDEARYQATLPAAKPKGKLGLSLALVVVIGLFLLAVLGAGGWYLATKTAHLDGLLGRGPAAEATPAEGGEEDGPGGQKELEEQQEEDLGAQEVVKEPGGEEVAGEEKGGESKKYEDTHSMITP